MVLGPGGGGTGATCLKFTAHATMHNICQYHSKHMPLSSQILASTDTSSSAAHARHTYTPAWHTWGADCAKDRHGLSVLQQGDEWPRVRQV